MALLAKPRRLRDGSWGALVAGTPRVGASILIEARNGRRWMAAVDRVLSIAPYGAIVACHGTGAPVAQARRRSSRCWLCQHTEDECADLDCTCRECGGMLR